MQTEAPQEQATTPSLLRFIVGRNPTWTVVRILLVVFVTLVVFKFILLPIRVTGESMFPTYRNGQVKFVNRLAYLKNEPQRGDVVAVEFAGKEVLLLKRVIALPGETFQVKNGEVLINGEKLAEPYANGKIPASVGNRLGYTEPIPMGTKEYMVLGDNRNISEGYIKERRQIIGKVL
jgi:signal peptidase I